MMSQATSNNYFKSGGAAIIGFDQDTNILREDIDRVIEIGSNTNLEFPR